MLDDDIEQVSKDINNFGTPLNAIDTQNRIWLKIITKEKLIQDQKRQYLMQQSSKHGQSAYAKSISGNGVPEPEEEL